jgi:hypothetical protein
MRVRHDPRYSCIGLRQNARVRRARVMRIRKDYSICDVKIL